jgi:hypothetical protein
MMNDETVKLFTLLTKKTNKCQKRSLQLLKPVDSNGTDESWAFCVPPGFNESLDIRFTERTNKGKKTKVWTQGGLFYFKAGDTIFDTPLAYGEWGVALQHIEKCIKVEFGVSSGQMEPDMPRSSGSVEFKLLKPNENRTALEESNETLKMSQDDFVYYLITGSMRD